MWYIIPGQAELAYSDDDDEEDELEEIEEEEEVLEELEDEEEKQPASLPTPQKKSMGRPPLFPNLPLRMPLPPLRPLSPGDEAHEEEEEEEKEEEEVQGLGAEIEIEHAYVPLTVAPAVGPDVDVVRRQSSSQQQQLEEVIMEEVEEEEEQEEEENIEQLVAEGIPLQGGGRFTTPALDRM